MGNIFTTESSCASKYPCGTPLTQANCASEYSNKWLTATNCESTYPCDLCGTPLTATNCASTYPCSSGTIITEGECASLFPCGTPLTQANCASTYPCPTIDKLTTYKQVKDEDPTNTLNAVGDGWNRADDGSGGYMWSCGPDNLYSKQIGYKPGVDVAFCFPDTVKYDINY